VSFPEKQALNDALLASGAPISDMNVIRKQISQVKGGRLAAACHPAQLVSLMISDVPGDDPSLIASGPTVGDDSTPEQALDILDRWAIDVPAHVRSAIAGNTTRVRTDDPRLERARHAIVAAPSKSLEACAQLAQAEGIEVHVLGDAIEGEARELAIVQANMATKIATGLKSTSKPVLLLSGGECTVTRRGAGVGGPNAEFVLAATLALQGHPQVHVLACDTDGVDGAAEVAGAYAGPQTLAQAQGLGVSAQEALADNDARNFFEALSSQIVCGPTLTNVNDFRALLILPPE
jgi:hydroxypyruvate reductase